MHDEDVEIYKQVVGTRGRNCNVLRCVGSHCGININNVCKRITKSGNRSGCMTYYGAKLFEGYEHKFETGDDAYNALNYVLFILQQSEREYCGEVKICATCAWLDKYGVCMRNAIREQMYYK